MFVFWGKMKKVHVILPFNQYQCLYGEVKKSYLILFPAFKRKTNIFQSSSNKVLPNISL